MERNQKDQKWQQQNQSKDQQKWPSNEKGQASRQAATNPQRPGQDQPQKKPFEKE